MFNSGRKFAGLFAIVVILFTVAGCQEGARVGELQTETQTIELGNSESVEVDIEIGAGELEVTGGAGELLEAAFTYNVEELNPRATLTGDLLEVHHDDAEGGIGTFFDLDDYQNEWDLRFNDDVPLDMSIDLGAGRTDLALGSLALSRLDLNTGAGEVVVDLSDSSSLNQLNLDMGAGELNLDLTGEWQDDLEASIQGGVGEMNLKLPDNVGVRVKVQTGIGQVDTSGLSKDGNVYTNKAYGESDVTLNIDVDGGVGKINLDVE